MKERQRWQPEEDAILKAYVKQYGPKDWSLVSQRTGEALSRDPKSCLERWKNYLKPGIKKGSLTLEEQSRVISLQAKYGNKWKKIAAELPGRTAKRLGKWWEVFKEKQLKQLQKTQQQQQQHQHNYKEYPSSDQGNIPSPGDSVAQGRYDHILETFAEKYVQPKLFGYQNLNLGPVLPCSMSLPDPDPVLSLGTGWTAPSFSSSSATTASPSVSLSLSPSEPRVDQDLTRCLPTQSMGTLLQYCKELEEGRQSWLQHKKEATWRLSRLEQQLESEKARKMREKMEEIEAKMICLREEEIAFLGRVESEYRDQLVALHRDAESKEAKLTEAWRGNHVKFSELIEQIRLRCHHGGFNAGTKDIHRST